MHSALSSENHHGRRVPHHQALQLIHRQTNPVARNSLRHGAFARAVVLDNESRPRFIALLSSLKEELQPRNSLESSLIENMAVARWNQMRMWSIENATLSNEISKQVSSDPETASLDPATRAAAAFRTLADNSRCLVPLAERNPAISISTTVPSNV